MPRRASTRSRPVVAGKGIDIKGNRHLKAKEDLPLANLQLTLLDKLGLKNVDQFGDSGGELNPLTGV